jgi:hypothetical protein
LIIAACSSRGPELVSTAPGTGLVTVIAADEGDVFFLSIAATTKQVVRQPKDGGAQTVLATDDGYPVELRVHGDEVFWVSQHADNTATILRMPKQGGTVSTLVDGEQVWGGLGFFEDRAYWGNNSGPGTTGPDGDGGVFNCTGAGLRSIALDGGDVSTLTFPGQFPIALTTIDTRPTVDSSGAYFFGLLGGTLDTQSPADAGVIGVHFIGCYTSEEFVVRVPLDGGLGTILARVGEDQYYLEPTVDETHVWFTSQRKVLRVPKDSALEPGMQQNPLAETVSPRVIPNPFAVHSDGLLACTKAMNGNTAVVKSPADGGAETLTDLGYVVPGAPFIAGDGDLYSVDLQRLYRVPLQ